MKTLEFQQDQIRLSAPDVVQVQILPRSTIMDSMCLISHRGSEQGQQPYKGAEAADDQREAVNLSCPPVLLCAGALLHETAGRRSVMSTETL